MNCLDSSNPETLVAYVAGELDQDAASALERHLADCPACQSLVAEQAAVWHALDSWEAPQISPDFDQRLYRRIENESRSSWWRRFTGAFSPMPLRQVLPLTATAGLLLMAGLLFYRTDTAIPTRSHVQTVRAEQVESTLDDMELLRDAM